MRSLHTLSYYSILTTPYDDVSMVLERCRKVVLPTLSIGYLLIPVSVSWIPRLVHVSPFARNTLPTLLGLFHSYSSFKTHLCVILLGRISYCVLCVSTILCSYIEPHTFVLNLIITMWLQVCLLPIHVHILPPDLRAEIIFYSPLHLLAAGLACNNMKY